MKKYFRGGIAAAKNRGYKDGMATNIEYNNRLRAESLRRSARIAKLREKGMTWAQIGERLGISRQRAQQLGSKIAEPVA